MLTQALPKPSLSERTVISSNERDVITLANECDINVSTYCAFTCLDERDVTIENTLTSAPGGCGIMGRPEEMLPPAPNSPTSSSSSKRIGDSLWNNNNNNDNNNDNNIENNNIDIDDIDDIEYVMSVLSVSSVEKFDSGASRCMSGDPSRLKSVLPNEKKFVSLDLIILIVLHSLVV